MNKLVLLFLIISSTGFAQDIKVEKATMQTVNHGASPTSSTTYTILISKAKKCKWQIDSVMSTASGQNVEFTITEIAEPEVLSPGLKKVSPKDLKNGNYMITFGVTKKRGSGGRPGSPQNTRVDTTNIEGGVIIYYSIKKKYNSIKVDTFEMLETLNAP
jgi:hypothetical protein